MSYNRFFSIFLFCIGVTTLTTSCNDIEEPFADEYPIKSSITQEGYQIVLATTDLAVGENRFAFIVLSETGFINKNYSMVTFYAPTKHSQESKKTAQFMYWDDLNRGSFVANVIFSYPGKWAFKVDLQDNKKDISIQGDFTVNKKPIAPNVGDKAPIAKNKTLDNVVSVQQLSTGNVIDPELYRHSIKDAIESGKPTVVTFSSPAFCRDEACGPQVKVLQTLGPRMNSSINFIHVEIYDNPVQLQNDSKAGLYSEVFKKWDLPSFQWTFIINCLGEISHRYQGFVSSEELDEALRFYIEGEGSENHCLVI
jgi:hypothetical protein